MSTKETNISKERTTNTDEKVLTLIKNIMSDFTEVVKMLTDTMNTQLTIIKEQENNSAEAVRLNNQAINRQLDIINDQNGFLKKIFDQIDTNDDKKLLKIVDFGRERKQC
ncbi:MAG: hypothetical protein EGP82_10190 [Odoribacter splanchnicus]|nr:hypothetical protein [Odoribacter splanchnicus]